MSPAIRGRSSICPCAGSDPGQNGAASDGTGPLPAQGHAIFTAAHSLLGTRFRLHGGAPESGLDCIGLILVAHAGAGVTIDTAGLRDDYALRGSAPAEVEAGLRMAGFSRRIGSHRCGDVALIGCGHGQHHLALLGPASHVHAHAGLRRVVETPGLPEGLRSIWHRV